MNYYNTTNQSGSTLKDYSEKAMTQDDVIMSLFKSKATLLSPSMILSMSGMNCPITSIRRSVTNLTKAGKLEKTDNQVLGLYGRPEYLWKLSK